MRKEGATKRGIAELREDAIETSDKVRRGEQGWGREGKGKGGQGRGKNVTFPTCPPPQQAQSDSRSAVWQRSQVSSLSSYGHPTPSPGMVPGTDRAYGAALSGTERQCGATHALAPARY
eukprot:2006783-Rhodomonas_salina.1